MSLRVSFRLLLAWSSLGIAFSGDALSADRAPIPAKAVGVEREMARRFDQGKKWAVVIGVNEYLDQAIPKLRYCVADARLVAKSLADKCGYDAERILLVVDNQEKLHLRPLKINLQQQITAWLKNAVRGDTVLVYFSGHGFLDERGQGFLAPQDCEKTQLGLTAFRTDDLRDMLHQCAATQKLLVLDCCHAGTAKSLDLLGPSSLELGQAFQKAEGLITLASCRKKEFSQEWNAKNQGLFTFFLARGLAGAADYDRNGLVDSDELYRYAMDNVPTTAQRELNAQQTPVRIIGDDVAGVFALARTASPPLSVPAEPSSESRRVTAVFQVRQGSENGPPAPDTTVVLWYQGPGKEKPVRLAQATSDEQGQVRMAVTLPAPSQAGGEYRAMVSKGDLRQPCPLPGFPASHSELIVLQPQRESKNGYRLDLAKAKLGDHPKGWSGSNFLAVGQWKGIPVLRCNAQRDFPHRLTCKEISLAGDFYLQFELIGDDLRDAGLKVSLLATEGQADFPLNIRGGYGNDWRIELPGTKPVSARGFPGHLGRVPVAFRLERRGDVYTVACLSAGSEPATLRTETRVAFSGLEIEFSKIDAQILSLHVGPLGGQGQAPQDALKAAAWPFENGRRPPADWRVSGGIDGQCRGNSPALDIGGDFAVEIAVAGASQQRAAAKNPERASLQVTLQGVNGSPDLPVLLHAHRGSAAVALPGVKDVSLDNVGAMAIFRIDRLGNVFQVSVNGRLAATCQAQGFQSLGGICLDCANTTNWTLRSVRVMPRADLR